jgi:hypothetical protein
MNKFSGCLSPLLVLTQKVRIHYIDYRCFFIVRRNKSIVWIYRYEIFWKYFLECLFEACFGSSEDSDGLFLLTCNSFSKILDNLLQFTVCFDPILTRIFLISPANKRFQKKILTLFRYIKKRKNICSTKRQSPC